MLWYILTYIQLKTLSGHTFPDIKVIKQVTLKEKNQGSKTFNYPIIN